MAERNLRSQITTLLHKSHLLSVGEILQRLEKSGKKYNKTSVYRSLENLVQENVICRHYFNDAEASYELHTTEHIHLFCRNCGTVEMSEVIPHVELVSNFKVEHQHVTLVGLCKKCQLLIS